MDRAVRILLVDDDPGDVLMITEALGSIGSPRLIDVVGDGQEAWDHLHSSAPRPDLVLLDLNMPRMDGRELLRRIKPDPTLGLIPTVVFTTSADQQDILSAYQGYANAYVVKPVDLDGMTDAVHRIDEFFTSVSRLSSN